MDNMYITYFVMSREMIYTGLSDEYTDPLGKAKHWLTDENREKAAAYAKEQAEKAQIMKSRRGFTRQVFEVVEHVFDELICMPVTNRPVESFDPVKLQTDYYDQDSENHKRLAKWACRMRTPRGDSIDAQHDYNSCITNIVLDAIDYAPDWATDQAIKRVAATFGYFPSSVEQDVRRKLDGWRGWNFEPLPF